MLELRKLDWPTDRAAVIALDTSYVADRRLRLDLTARCATLVEDVLPELVHRTYGLVDIVEKLADHAWVRVANQGAEIAGLAALSFEPWNRRARLEHLYVAKQARRQGVGRALVEAAVQAARALGARGVWVETQTTNYPAVLFYEQVGFRWCGLDSSLYDPQIVTDDEVGIFFWRDLSERRAR